MLLFVSDNHSHHTIFINQHYFLWTFQILAINFHPREKQKLPLATRRVFCRCCPPLNYPSTSFPNPFSLEVVKKYKKIQPDVSPVSSVIHKAPNTPHSSLMLYEKLKLNQGTVIKLSDFCWIRMNSCVCHIVSWKCAWGASGLRMHIHQLLVEMDLFTMGHLRFFSHRIPALHTVWILQGPPTLKIRKGD